MALALVETLKVVKTSKLTALIDFRTHFIEFKLNFGSIFFFLKGTLDVTIKGHGENIKCTIHALFIRGWVLILKLNISNFHILELSYALCIY